jgi:hypothetical protein
MKFALPSFSNVKDGQAMATRKLAPEELQAVKRLAKQWGKIVVKHAFGEQGPGLDVDFAQMIPRNCSGCCRLDAARAAAREWRLPPRPTRDRLEAFHFTKPLKNSWPSRFLG